MVGRFSRGVLPSSRCYSVYEVQQAIDAHWSVFPLEWFHLLRKVCYSFSNLMNFKLLWCCILVSVTDYIRAQGFNPTI